ncbi:hypothetical protein [Geothrix terrae]|uniref:hypothetical protein n=1 Tax=Geothrix terrae TaxID=2922720 RepID=UPI001FAD0B0F|nr:hypothetical protein [Geothrix terrae]
MLAEAFALVLQLPPLAFSPAAPAAFRPPRELTCPVGELGRPWSPPSPRPLWSARLAVDPRDLRPREPAHLVNPLADLLLLFALAGWASSTGGTVDFRPWPDRNPLFATPPMAPYASPVPWAKPGF